jgi:hypothetical protein
MNQPLVINGVTINTHMDINHPRVQYTIGEIADYIIGIRQELPDGVNPQQLQNIMIYVCRTLLLEQINNDNIGDAIAITIYYLYTDAQEQGVGPIVIDGVIINTYMDINDLPIQSFIRRVANYITGEGQELPNDVNHQQLQNIMIYTCRSPLFEQINRNDVTSTVAVAIYRLGRAMQQILGDEFNLPDLDEPRCCLNCHCDLL